MAAAGCGRAIRFFSGVGPLQEAPVADNRLWPRDVQLGFDGLQPGGLLDRTGGRTSNVHRLEAKAVRPAPGR